MNESSELLILLRLRGTLSPSLLTKWWKQDPSLSLTGEKNHLLTKLSLKRSDLCSIRKLAEQELSNVKQLIRSYEAAGVRMTAICSPDYPASLKTIHDPPPVLFLKGNVKLLHEQRLIGIVGTRSPSLYGKRAAVHLVRELCKKSWTIVSGLAKGIDGLAHQESIRSKGRTIGVIAGGFNSIYPREHRQLAGQMAENHLLVSEHPPDVKPQKWHFPMRNRLISGLTEGIVVVQGKEKSGSLITAYQALEQGREVFAVPGPIFDASSFGPSRLIQEGAKLVLNIEDILSELPPSRTQYIEPV
ncbi:Rossmann fold nucleotide-binding protein Smf involved in DNA uptake [Bacillus paralicheniformis]|uniref:DNA-processing protein DprA n=1 Tax=Bacillus TaxID=1386 RepID=UPI00080E7243|nr:MULTISPECIES: DNA-processing protein DprA [Bacillus]MDE1382199.1 DNA-processing protein DprA [Bacillus paralicheniformis]OLG13550.1 Rossmann fold nucleotide-binding protein Smf involved in DNA uptake [Bacillus paralicheniformis]PRS17645.1 DNA-protecting protein DprA [Bacillus paralicheniformis]QII48942.1 DNA-protecting protein DprA [Bacillus paralicheniformis]TAI51726.1 DNA-protecting protein DprA [Bacillus paralicheniformis]